MKRTCFCLIMLVLAALLIVSSSSGKSSKKQTITPNTLFTKESVPLKKIKAPPRVRKPRALSSAKRIAVIKHFRQLAGVSKKLNPDPPINLILTPGRRLVGKSCFVTLNTAYYDPRQKCLRLYGSRSSQPSQLIFHFQTAPGKQYFLDFTISGVCTNSSEYDYYQPNILGVPTGPEQIECPTIKVEGVGSSQQMRIEGGHLLISFIAEGTMKEIRLTNNGCKRAYFYQCDLRCLGEPGV